MARYDLTETEILVLTAMAHGATNRGIADLMFLKEKTIKSHVYHIFLKLESKTRTEAVWTGLKKGYITPPERES